MGIIKSTYNPEGIEGGTKAFLNNEFHQNLLVNVVYVTPLDTLCLVRALNPLKENKECCWLVKTAELTKKEKIKEINLEVIKK